MATLRFCAYQYQHLPLDVLAQRWREAERLRFEVLWNCDTVVEPDRPRHPMYDGPTTLTLMAAATRGASGTRWCASRRCPRGRRPPPSPVTS